MGRSLDDLGHSLSWRDLRVLVRRWQKLPGTGLNTAMFGEQWPLTDQLIAELVDLIALGNWQRQGKPHAAKPKRLPRPWEKAKTMKFGSDPIPASKFSDWWNSFTSKKQRRKRG